MKDSKPAGLAATTGRITGLDVSYSDLQHPFIVEDTDRRMSGGL